MTITHIVNSEQTKKALHDQIDRDFEKHGYSSYSIKHGISSSQFGALHVWCGQCADLLNAAGIDMKSAANAMKEGFSVWHTKDTFKHMFYKPVLKAIEGKDSTKDQNTVDPQKVQQVLSKFMAERFGVVAPEWPAKNKGDK